MAGIQLPAHLQNRTGRNFAETTIANLGTASPPYVSIMGSRFTLVDAGGAQEAVTTVDPKTGMPYLDCAIIDSGDHSSRIYFGHDFDPSAQSYSPPKCWSDNGTAPSMNASEPQARSCTADPTGVNGCKLAVWGSATSKVTGKGIPACGKYQKLALALPGDDVIFLLRVPPNSLDNLRTYFSKCKASGIEPWQIMTRISFEKDGKLGTLTFAGTEWVSAELMGFIDKAYAAKATDALVGRHDRPIASAVLPPVTVVPGLVTLPAPTVVQTAPQTTAPTPTVVQPAVQPAAEAAPKPRGRPRKAESAPAGTPAPFMPSAAPAAVNGPPANFGVAQPAQPDAQLANDIASVFS